MGDEVKRLEVFSVPTGEKFVRLEVYDALVTGLRATYICVYCRKRIGSFDDYESRTAAARKHVSEECPDSPLRKLSSELASWQARAERRMDHIADIAVALQTPEGKNSAEYGAELRARAEQAEATIAAWKKDAEDKAVLIAELTKRANRMAAPVSNAEWLGLCSGDHVDETEVRRSDIDRLILSRSTDLEREG